MGQPFLIAETRKEEKKGNAGSFLGTSNFPTGTKTTQLPFRRSHIYKDLVSLVSFSEKCKYLT